MVNLTGTQANDGFDILQNGTSFELSIKDGRLSVADDVVGNSDFENDLLNAIRSTDRTLTLDFTTKNLGKDMYGIEAPIVGGLFGGGKWIEVGKTAKALQRINIEHFLKGSKKKYLNENVMHEVMEGVHSALFLPASYDVAYASAHAYSSRVYPLHNKRKWIQLFDINRNGSVGVYVNNKYNYLYSIPQSKAKNLQFKRNYK